MNYMAEQSRTPILLLKNDDGTFAEVHAGSIDGMNCTFAIDDQQFPEHIPPSEIPLENVSPYKSRFYVSDNPNPKQENWCQSFSCSGEVEIPIDTQRSLFGLDDDDTQHIKADVEFEPPEGKRYFVKDADIEINVCPALPHKPKPLLWDKLPCDMITQLCHPLRWGDKHFNRRIAHYQWMKQHNYL